jgi:polysaccharide pyruvyl transferase CsaB
MRALVAGWIGSTNLGDELVFAGLRRHLAALGMDATAISIRPEHTVRHHGVEAVRHRDPRDSFGLWSALDDADVLVFGGGGLIQDQTSPWNIPFHTSRVLAARMRRVPWAGVGLGVDPVGARWLRALIRSGLAGSLGFGVRDQQSAHSAAELGLTPRLTADLAFALPAASSEAGPGDHLVVSLRPPTHSGVGTAAVKARRPVDPGWVAGLAAGIDRIAGAEGLDVRFVAFQPDRDTAMAESVATRMATSAELIDATLDEVVATMATAQGILTMRYHGAVTAALAGRPAVLLDYSPKMAQLAADVGPGFAAVPVESPARHLADAWRQVREHRSLVAEGRGMLIEREMGNRRILEYLVERGAGS